MAGNSRKRRLPKSARGDSEAPQPPAGPPALPRAGSETAAPTPPPLDGVDTSVSLANQPPPVSRSAPAERTIGSDDSAASTQSAAGPVEPTGPTDPDIAQFIDQAGPVLAIERGINAKSRVKLSAIADEIGLSDEQFEQAMNLLQGREPETEVSPEEARRQRRRLRAYHDMVGQSLMQLPQGVLTGGMQTMLVGAGSDYGLTPEQATAEVQSLAEKLRVRCISTEEAERHIRELAEAAMAAKGRLAPQQRQRLTAEATQWGLTAEQATPILDEIASRHHQRERSEQFRNVALITGAAVVLVGVLGVVVWMAVVASLPDGDGSADQNQISTFSGADSSPPRGGPADDTSGSGDGPTDAKPLPVPKWWDAKLSTATVHAQLKQPALADHLRLIRSPDDSTRIAAYKAIAAKAAPSSAEPRDLEQMAELFGGAYALEPSEAAAEAIRGLIVDAASGPVDQKPKSYSPYRRALWAGRAGFHAMWRARANEPRRTAMADALGRSLGVSIDSAADFQPLRQSVLQAVSVQLLRTLASNAEQAPNIAVSLHKQLTEETDAFLSTEAADQAQTDFLMAVLPELGERWLLYEDLLRQCVQSDDPLNALKLLDLFERIEDPQLQAFLAAQLTVRAELRAERRTASELAAAVRAELGAADLPIAGDQRTRYRTWRRQVNDLLSTPAAAATDPAKLLDQTVKLAHLSTMGHALSLQDIGAPEFNSLDRTGMPKLVANDEDDTGPRRPRPPSRTTSSGNLRQLDRAVSSLANFRRLDPSQRVQALRNISAYTRIVDDLSPQQGADVAAYLAYKKTVSEASLALAAAGDVVKWPSVRLALADELAESELRTDDMAKLLSKALTRAVELDGADRWREEFRVELLNSVLNDLGATTAAAPAPTTNIYDTAAAMLAERLRTQGKLLSTSLPADQALPGELQPALLQAWADKVSAAATSPDDSELLASLPQQITAAKYVGGHDLAKSIALDRLLLRLLAVEVGRVHPDRRRQADEIVDHVARQDTIAKHLLDQLRQGQEGLLRMWIVINEP